MDNRYRVLLAVALCASACAAEASPGQTCDDAASALRECGIVEDESPFGTCQPDQHRQAADVMDVYDEGGCAALKDSKSDGLTCAVLPFLCVNHSVDELAPFVTDGCSMFPDGTLAETTKWQRCCVIHDFSYYIGGPEDSRAQADEGLKSCVSGAATPALGELMWAGVRVGGTPSIPTPWRWGYGWSYDPQDGYREIPVDQREAALAELEKYMKNPVAPMAFEQRVRALFDDVKKVPDLPEAVDEVNDEVEQLPQ